MDKEIEEMANLIYDNRPIKDIWNEEAEEIAKMLYNVGYRKLDDHAILVLRKAKGMEDKIRKETAGEILKEVGKTCGDYQWFKNLCKQYGVEVE